jgi:hypothetical protein
MSTDTETQMHRLVGSIRSYRSTVDAEARRLRTPAIIESFDLRSHRSWCLSVVGDSLVRVRLLLEQNFNFIETVGVIAVARYLFELSVWLKLFERDARYGLVYYAQLLDMQRRYFDDQRSQLAREISLLRAFEEKEKERTHGTLRGINSQSEPKAIVEQLKAVKKDVDSEAARHFSIYAEQAKINGYGFQAYLVETKAIPHVIESIAAIASERADFDANVSSDTRELIPKRWEWRKMAERVDLTDEYDYLYTFASKLLHATPASITTDHKNLEPSELVVFLKYISVKLVDLVENAQMYPRDAA